MPQFIEELKRTHYCGELTAAELQQEVVLMGWVQNRRDHGGCVFIDLRDREGVVQVVFDPHLSSAAHTLAGELRSEWVIGLQGVVRSRGDNKNPRLKTGEIEIAASALTVFSRAQTPPFALDEEVDTAEEIRLRYRYLDLRRPSLQRNLWWRHKCNQIVRQVLSAQGFLELETPFLIKSTPEGARDYVVPSRVNPGKFFALPQSPQLFKQLFMVSGFDRYFQITRCFRDEDLRAERQPEFTQLDVEMSFVSALDIQQIMEEVVSEVWDKLLGLKLVRPFKRLSWDEAMSKYGVDAPDLRFGLHLQEVSEIFSESNFKVFKDVLAQGGIIKAINISQRTWPKASSPLSRSDLDNMTGFVQNYGAKGLAWIKIKEDGEWQSPIAKFLSAEERRKLTETLKLESNDIVVFVADKPRVVNAALGALRKHIAKLGNLIPDNVYEFCWVTDFPAFEWDEATRRYYAAHHPFTAPRAEHRHLLASDPSKVKAEAYDLVLNGVELGGGSLRIHDSELQREVFTALGIGEKEAEEKFGFLIEALSYGAPPHGGIALGMDRLLMLLLGTPSIRDVIAFPKTQKQTDLMIEAPAPLAPEQLVELGILVAPLAKNS